MAKFVTDNRDPILDKALSAMEEVKVSDLAQLNMSQQRAIGKRGRADDGDSGKRRGSRSFLERECHFRQSNKEYPYV